MTETWIVRELDAVAPTRGSTARCYSLFPPTETRSTLPRSAGSLGTAGRAAAAGPCGPGRWLASLAPAPARRGRAARRRLPAAPAVDPDSRPGHRPDRRGARPIGRRRRGRPRPRPLRDLSAAGRLALSSPDRRPLQRHRARARHLRRPVIPAPAPCGRRLRGRGQRLQPGLSRRIRRRPDDARVPDSLRYRPIRVPVPARGRRRARARCERCAWPG